MIVNLDESLYEFQEARKNSLVLKSKISGVQESWIVTNEEDGVYLIRYKDQLYKYHEAITSPKEATVRAIKAISSIKHPIHKEAASKAYQSLLSLLASLAEPRRVGGVMVFLADTEVETPTIPLHDHFLKLSEEKGIWEALSICPYKDQVENPGAIASLQKEYQDLKADFLKLADEKDQPILAELGENLFSCVLGECELENKLEGLSRGMKSRLSEYQPKIQELKRKIYSFMKMDPLSDVETDY